jgi:hypothetical protein
MQPGVRSWWRSERPQTRKFGKDAFRATLHDAGAVTLTAMLWYSSCSRVRSSAPTLASWLRATLDMALAHASAKPASSSTAAFTCSQIQHSSRLSVHSCKVLHST